MNPALITAISTFAGAIIGTFVTIYVWGLWKRRAERIATNEIIQRQREDHERFMREVFPHFTHGLWRGNPVATDGEDVFSRKWVEY